jgi:hypothetical protein
VQKQKRKKKMKKIMIAAAIVCAAVMAQAASYSWSNPYGLNGYNSPGDEGPFYSGTAYLMNAVEVSQTAFISAVLGAGDKYADAFATQVGSAFHSADIDAGATFTSDVYASGSDQSFYVVVLDTANNGVYVSEVVSTIVAVTGSSPLEFEHTAAYENSAFADTQKTFAGAGWYTAVPEPTSGLLMLVGLAGLALRRRRA